jgi:hypothetical protein
VQRGQRSAGQISASLPLDTVSVSSYSVYPVDQPLALDLSAPGSFFFLVSLPPVSEATRQAGGSAKHVNLSRIQ